jgi:hypothetical protein
VTTRTKFVLGFATTGFAVGAALCAYTFYVTSSHHRGSPPSLALYLLLCPPSLGAMALDNAGVAGGLIGWALISFMNAALSALYALIGLGFGLRAEKNAIWTTYRN